MANNQRMEHAVSQVKHQVDDSGYFVDHRVLTWNSASRSRIVFLSQFPDLTVSIADTLSLMGESEGGEKRRQGKSERERKRDTDTVKRRYLY